MSIQKWNQPWPRWWFIVFRTNFHIFTEQESSHYCIATLVRCNQSSAIPGPYKCPSLCLSLLSLLIHCLSFAMASGQGSGCHVCFLHSSGVCFGQVCKSNHGRSSHNLFIMLWMKILYFLPRLHVRCNQTELKVTWKKQVTDQLWQLLHVSYRVNLISASSLITFYLRRHCFSSWDRNRRILSTSISREGQQEWNERSWEARGASSRHLRKSGSRKILPPMFWSGHLKITILYRFATVDRSINEFVADELKQNRMTRRESSTQQPFCF